VHQQGLAVLGEGQPRLGVAGEPALDALPQPCLDLSPDTGVVPAEQVDQIGEFGLGQVVDVLVHLGRAALAEAEAGVVEVGTEAFELDAVGATRWLPT